ncbi:MAG: DinB family protein, partial [Chitinophagaceae bacterium]
MTISRPIETEYNDFFKGYVNGVPQDDLITALRQTGEEVARVFKSIPPEIEVFRYDTNKWSIKEVLMHLADYERYFAFKALVALRNDTDTVLYHPKREHYLFNAGCEKRHLADLVPEFEITRAATISL